LLGYTSVVWSFADEPWQYRVLDALPAGVDAAQLERTRKLTPSERIDALVELMSFAEALQVRRAPREPAPWARACAKDLVDLEALRALAKQGASSHRP
jgi:hypothetical protein